MLIKTFGYQTDAALKLVVELYYDLCSKCGHAPEQRDIEYLSRRYHHEGFSFFAEALPTIGRDLERAIERGYVDSMDFCFFRKRKSTKCPHFLRVFFSHVFDDTGQLLPEADPISIGSIRQLTYFFKKIKEVCNDERIEKALQSYRVVEQELSTYVFPEQWRNIYSIVSSCLWSGLNEFNSFEALPRHGPGAVFEQVRGADKFPLTRSSWTERLDEFFPFDRYCAPNLNFYNEEDYTWSCEGSKPVFVLAVPKTALKPRLIGEESVANMYCQQAIKRWTYDFLENGDCLSKRHINFTNQEINKRLALKHSFTRKFATLDMSEASDRVPLTNIKLMLECSPNYLEPLLSCRAEYALVPTVVSQIHKGPDKCPCDLVHLRKFASMGSACCFPIEAMYFYTICVCALLGPDSTPSYSDIKSASRKIWVYGDDIVVPSVHVESVTSALVAFGNKVNVDKSFWKGFFRESCGMDAYKGVEITPVYMRRHIPSKQTDPNWLSIVETSNQLYENGLWRSANLLVQMAEQQLGQLPVAEKESVGLHLWSFQGVPTDLNLRKPRVRYSPDIQSNQYKIWQWYGRNKVPTRATGRDLLLSFLIDKESTHIQDHWSPCSIDVGHDRAVIDRPGDGTLKLRWYPPVPKVDKLT